jgi:pectinesterase inhibitor-like protein
MNLLQALFFLPAILLLVAASSTSNASVLQDTCKNVAASPEAIGYDYCLNFFQADKGSATADKRGLAAIAARITAGAARSTSSRVAALKASAKDKKVVDCLNTCAELYSIAVDQTSQAARSIASGNTGGLQDPVSALSAAMGAPETCEQGFSDLNLRSPLAAEDAEFNKKATIAPVVTSALKSA